MYWIMIPVDWAGFLTHSQSVLLTMLMSPTLTTLPVLMLRDGLSGSACDSLQLLFSGAFSGILSFRRGPELPEASAVGLAVGICATDSCRLATRASRSASVLSAAAEASPSSFTLSFASISIWDARRGFATVATEDS